MATMSKLSLRAVEVLVQCRLAQKWWSCGSTSGAQRFLSSTPCLLLSRPLESEETWVCTMLSSPASTEATRRSHNMSKIQEEKNCQPRIQCPVVIFFKNEVEIKTFSDEGKLRELSPADLLSGKYYRQFLFVMWVPSTHPHPLPCSLTVPSNVDVPPLPLDQFRNAGALGLGPETRKKAKGLCMGHGSLGGRMAPNTTTNVVGNLRQASCFL